MSDHVVHLQLPWPPVARRAWARGMLRGLWSGSAGVLVGLQLDAWYREDLLPLDRNASLGASAGVAVLLLGFGVLAWTVRGLRGDREAGAAQGFYGVTLPFQLITLRFAHSPPRSLQDCRHVVVRRNVRRVVRRADDGAFEETRRRVEDYTLELEGVFEPEVGHDRDPDRLRAEAERVAKLLGLGVHDTTLGSKRAAGALDIGWAARHLGDPTWQAPLPDPPRFVERAYTSDGVHLRLAVSGQGLASIISALLAFGGLVLVPLMLYALVTAQEVGDRVACGLLAGVGLLALAPITSEVRREELILGKRGEVRAIFHSWLGRRVVPVALDQLEELAVWRPSDLGQQQVLLLRGDGGSVQIGRGRAEETLKWLQHAVAEHLFEAERRRRSLGESSLDVG